MKVTIALLGRFGAFNFAEQLERHDALHKLVTVYPKYFVTRWRVPKEKIVSLLWLGVLGRSCLYLPHSWEKWINRSCILLFDFFSSWVIPRDSDIVIGWSNCCLRNLKKASGKGAVTVLVRGSAHILDQDELVSEEYRLWGENLEHIVDDFTVRREIAGYDSSDYILVPSSFAKSTFVKRGYPPEKILENPYGVDLKMFHRMPRNDEKFRIIYCGALSLEKGVPYLLQAFCELDLPNSELWLIGGMTPPVRQQLDRYRNDKVIWKGTYPQTELSKLFSEGDVFVQYSIQDGFAMTIVQAMACGLPVICSTNTGGPDVIEDGVHGFILPIRDPEALKEKLRYCHDHPDECKKMGAAAEAHAIHDNSWDLYGDRADSLYRKILEKRRHEIQN